MAKKKNTKSKKKNQNLEFNTEYHNLVTIFTGIFLLYSLNSNSMGFVGSMMQTIFKGLFGESVYFYTIYNSYYGHTWFL